MTQTIDREVSRVSTFLQSVEARGVQKGIQQGFEEGVVASLNGLMKTTGWPFEKAISTLNIPQDQWKNYSKLVEQ